MLGLGMVGGISAETPAQMYTDLSLLSNYEDLDIWFDFSNLTYGENAIITSVANKGQGGDDYNIDSNEGTPQYMSTTPGIGGNGLGSAYFDGSDEVLDMAGDYVTTGKPMTLFIVFSKADTTNDYLLVSSDDSATDYIRSAAGGDSITFKGNNEAAVTIAVDDTANSTVAYSLTALTMTLWVLRRNADGELTIYANNFNKIAFKDNAAIKAAATFKLGAIGGTTSGSLADTRGNICEVGIYDADIGAANTSLLMDSLCKKWGITI